MPRFRILALSVLALSLSLPVHAIEPIKRVPPNYPPQAARDRVEGFVEVEFAVDATGKVSSVSVVNARPSRTFEAAAVAAVKQWEFAPAAGRGKVRLDFTL